jgi:hypothetical protein
MNSPLQLQDTSSAIRSTTHGLAHRTTLRTKIAHLLYNFLLEALRRGSVHGVALEGG